MAQTNYTPISLYYSTTASAVPVNTNLVNGELAINITDGKLFYKDNGGTVQVLATKGAGTIGGSNTQVQYNNSGALAGSANLTFNGTTLTANTLNLTNALGTTYGGTGLTSFTANGVVYASSSSVLATGSALTFDGATLTVNNSTGGVFAVDSTGANVFRGLHFKASGTLFGYVLANSSIGELRSYIGPSVGWGGFQTWYIDNSEQMRLTSTGLGIGTSSPSVPLQINKNGVDTTAGWFSISKIQDGSANKGLDVGYLSGSQTTALVAATSSAASNMSFWTYSGSAWGERMRLDSSGNLLVGTSAVGGKLYVVSDLTSNNGCRIDTPASFTSVAIISNSATAGSTSWNHIAGNGNGGSQTNFIIYGNGNMVNANNSYGAVSDVRLKENIADASPKLADLMQVKVRNYNLIGETTKQIGVVAQELETVFPSMIDETVDKDVEGNELGTTTKQVKYSVFVPMLIKAMQEQQALIQSLTDRIAQLEAK